MSKITIEEIKGKKYTVVWHANMSKNYMRSELTWLPLKNGCLINYPWEAATQIATALPALPRNPKPSDAALIWRYMAEGILPMLRGVDTFYPAFFAVDDKGLWDAGETIKISHATHNGERVKIAITDEAHNG